MTQAQKANYPWCWGVWVGDPHGPDAKSAQLQDVVDAFAFNTTSPVVACSFSSDAVLIGHLFPLWLWTCSTCS